MEKNHKQDQRAGDNSTNIQASSIFVSQGITYDEARQLALDVFNSNFVQLAGEAADIAELRVRRFVEAYLKTLFEQHPRALSSARDPDMQYMLYEAQKLYARTGDDFVADLLIDILVKRAPLSQRTFLQIVLNEALTTISKITAQHMDCLAVIFLLRYLLHERPKSRDSLFKMLRAQLIPLARNMPDDTSTYLYLEYTGCVRSNIGGTSAVDILRLNYHNIFSRDVTDIEYASIIGKFPGATNIFESVGNKYRIKLMDIGQVDTLGGPKDSVKDLQKVMTEFILDSTTAKQLILETCPESEVLFHKWENADAYDLTSVGIAIAQTNLRKKFDSEYDLSQWLRL